MRHIGAKKGACWGVYIKIDSAKKGGTAMQRLHWDELGALPSRTYTCGCCGSPLASERGWKAKTGSGGNFVAFIYVCHQCTRPTFFDPARGQVPGVTFGSSVADVPDAGIIALYDVARTCTGAGAYTAAVLACRKLLMHIAVAKGAKPGATFISYVEYLANQNYIPPDAKEWVDHIRAKSNEANHEIVIMPKEDAEELVSFIEMLLRVIFEFPAAIKKKAKTP